MNILSTLWFGLKVAFVGMLVVFVGLIILIGCIKALKAISREKETPPAASGGGAQALPDAPAPTPPAPIQQAVAAPARTYVPGPLLSRKDDAFYAVLTAAVSQVMADEGINPDGGFVIRDIKTVSERKMGPPIGQKDDAFYAVLTAAIARVLADEGVNPEGGFAIRAVKAI